MIQQAKPLDVEESAANDPLLISADQFASMIQLSTRTLWRLLSAGKLPEPVRIGGSVRWRIDDVKLWIASGCPARGEE